eukprot:jgi/Tetstr1/458521/TSEL_044926.t1
MSSLRQAAEDALAAAGRLAYSATASLPLSTPESVRELPVRLRWALHRDGRLKETMMPDSLGELTALDATQMVAFSQVVLSEWAAHGSVPPGVAGLAAALCGVFLKPGGVPFTAVCLSPYLVIRRGEYHRLLTSVVVHRNWSHLTGNLGALVGEGCWLERHDGTLPFLLETAAAAVTSGALTVGVSYLLAKYDPSHRDTYHYAGGIGFSCVAVALTTIGGFRRGGRTRILGILDVPSEISCWCQILSSQLLAPGSSFLGHMCGLASGLAITAAPCLAAAILPGRQRGGARRPRGQQAGQRGQSAGSRRLLRIGPLQMRPWLVHLLCAAGVVGVELLLVAAKGSRTPAGRHQRTPRWV